MDQNIQTFIDGKRMALVGASRKGGKMGNTVLQELTERGYTISLVHPEAESIDGVKCHPNLQALAGQVDGVIVNVPPQQSLQVLKDASEAGIKNVWLQMGATSSEVEQLGQELGLNVTASKCILMYAGEVTSIHKVHRWIWKLIGQY
jgi:uncharacterized protein